MKEDREMEWRTALQLQIKDKYFMYNSVEAAIGHKILYKKVSC